MRLLKIESVCGWSTDITIIQEDWKDGEEIGSQATLLDLVVESNHLRKEHPDFDGKNLPMAQYNFKYTEVDHEH